VADPIFSPSWYRVADLKPRLRRHSEIHRHVYRDEVWYVLEDHASGRYHRFSPQANQIVSALDGRTTVDDIWHHAVDALGDDAPTQDETLRLLGQLYAADLIQADVTPDTAEMFHRFRESRRKKLVQRLKHPLAIKIPLFDPERFLAATTPLIRPIFSWVGFGCWLVAVVWGAMTAAENWGALTENITDRVLAPQNLLIIWLVYPVVKAIHEFGHAYATKIWGGQVHEMGVMLLVFVPVPYVDASAASAFTEKRKRMVVGGAGIMVELMIAVIALFVWLRVEPGIVSAIAYNAMLIGGVSTLFFNGNPLLRFDGYYVLADFLEMPNLATRSKSYFAYLVKRYAFGLEHASFLTYSSAERFWLASYGVASTVYRFFIMFVIVLFVAGRFFFVGVLIAAWAVLSQIGGGLWKGLKFLFASSELSRKRPRAVAVSATAVALALAIVFVPMPLRTVADGVTWSPERSQLRAGADGFVVAVAAGNRDSVTSGQTVITLEDPLLLARQQVLEARRRELAAQLAIHRFEDRSAADVVRQEIETVDAELARSQEKVDALVIRAPVDGWLALDSAADLIGSFVRRGETLGYVIDDAPQTVKVVVGQERINLMRERVTSTEVFPVVWGGEPVPAEISRTVPGGSRNLPSAALGTQGGGEIVVDPQQRDPTQTLERVFLFDVTLAGELPGRFVGERVQVRFDHGYEPLALQWTRSLRQLFLRQFGV